MFKHLLLFTTVKLSAKRGLNYFHLVQHEICKIFVFLQDIRMSPTEFRLESLLLCYC